MFGAILNSATQKHLQTLVCALTLAISLWVVRSGELELGAEWLEKKLPDNTVINAVVVIDDHVCHAMELDHRVDEHSSDSRSSVWMT